MLYLRPENVRVLGGSARQLEAGEGWWRSGPSRTGRRGWGATGRKPRGSRRGTKTGPNAGAEARARRRARRRPPRRSIRPSTTMKRRRRRVGRIRTGWIGGGREKSPAAGGAEDVAAEGDPAGPGEETEGSVYPTATTTRRRRRGPVPPSRAIRAGPVAVKRLRRRRGVRRRATNLARSPPFTYIAAFTLLRRRTGPDPRARVQRRRGDAALPVRRRGRAGDRRRSGGSAPGVKFSARGDAGRRHRRRSRRAHERVRRSPVRNPHRRYRGVRFRVVEPRIRRVAWTGFDVLLAAAGCAAGEHARRRRSGVGVGCRDRTTRSGPRTFACSGKVREITRSLRPR